MGAGAGIDVEFGFAIESTQNTRVAPDTFIRATQESLALNQEFIRSAGLGGGRIIQRRKALGTKSPGGSFSMEVGTTELANLLVWATSLDPTPSGSDPYTRSFAGVGSGLTTATFGVVRPFDGGEEYFEYPGSAVSQFTLTQNPNEFAMAQLELMSYDETTDQTKETYAPPADEQLLTFNDVTITPYGGSAECFDGFTLNVNQNLTRSFKSCSTAARRGDVRRNGMVEITGTLNDDFKDMSHYNRYVAGTEGALVIAYSGANSSTLTITMNIFFTGETPNVSGPGEVKQGLPFEVISGTSDAAAFTVELVNGES